MPDDVGLRGKQSHTYKLVNKLKKEVIHDSTTVSKKFNVEVQNDFKTLPVMNFKRYTRLRLEQGLLLNLENVAQRLCQTQSQKLLNQFLSKFKVSIKSNIFTLITEIFG